PRCHRCCANPTMRRPPPAVSIASSTSSSASAPSALPASTSSSPIPPPPLPPSPRSPPWFPPASKRTLTAEFHAAYGLRPAASGRHLRPSVALQTGVSCARPSPAVRSNVPPHPLH